MERLSQERQQLCWRLAAAAAPAPTAQGPCSRQAERAAEAQIGAPAGPGTEAAAVAAAAAGAVSGAAPAGGSGGLDALAEQSELADLIAANTARMGGLLQLHLIAPYAVLTDLQRARLLFQCFPIPTNAAKCAAALAHLLKFEPAALPPAAELGLRSEMARWAPLLAGPPWGRSAGDGDAPAAGVAHAGAPGAWSGDAASSGAAAAACPATDSPAPDRHA
jgi:hypothetical protein